MADQPKAPVSPSCNFRPSSKTANPRCAPAPCPWPILCRCFPGNIYPSRARFHKAALWPAMTPEYGALKQAQSLSPLQKAPVRVPAYWHCSPARAAKTPLGPLQGSWCNREGGCWPSNDGCKTRTSSQANRTPISSARPRLRPASGSAGRSACAPVHNGGKTPVLLTARRREARHRPASGA
jgi:hypothetical protein